MQHVRACRSHGARAPRAVSAETSDLFQDERRVNQLVLIIEPKQQRLGDTNALPHAPEHHLYASDMQSAGMSHMAGTSGPLPYEQQRRLYVHPKTTRSSVAQQGPIPEARTCTSDGRDT
jgi:hypothetical protein